MADTLKRLVGPTQLSSAPATVYTTPAATTTIIRDITVANTTSGAVTFTMSIGGDAAGTRLYSAVSIPANSSFQRTGSIILTATEIIQAYAGALSSLTLTVNGVEST